MSQSKIMGTVTESVRFIKDRLKNKIYESSTSEGLDLSDDQVRKLLFVVESSIDESYNRTMTQIMNQIDESFSTQKNTLMSESKKRKK